MAVILEQAEQITDSSFAVATLDTLQSEEVQSYHGTDYSGGHGYIRCW